MAKNLTDEVVSASPSVKNKIDAAAETLQNKQNGEISETDILNFALNLEYLEQCLLLRKHRQVNHECGDRHRRSCDRS